MACYLISRGEEEKKEEEGETEKPKAAMEECRSIASDWSGDFRKMFRTQEHKMLLEDDLRDLLESHVTAARERERAAAMAGLVDGRMAYLRQTHHDSSWKETGMIPPRGYRSDWGDFHPTLDPKNVGSRHSVAGICHYVPPIVELPKRAVIYLEHHQLLYLLEEILVEMLVRRPASPRKYLLEWLKKIRGPIDLPKKPKPVLSEGTICSSCTRLANQPRISWTEMQDLCDCTYTYKHEPRRLVRGSDDEDEEEAEPAGAEEERAEAAARTAAAAAAAAKPFVERHDWLWWEPEPEPEKEEEKPKKTSEEEDEDEEKKEESREEEKSEEGGEEERKKRSEEEGEAGEEVKGEEAEAEAAELAKGKGEGTSGEEPMREEVGGGGGEEEEGGSGGEGGGEGGSGGEGGGEGGSGGEGGGEGGSGGGEGGEGGGGGEPEAPPPETDSVNESYTQVDAAADLDAPVNVEGADADAANADADADADAAADVAAEADFNAGDASNADDFNNEEIEGIQYVNNDDDDDASVSSLDYSASSSSEEAD